MPVVIKRYANRKLYNSQTKAYVTLEEIANLVRAGEDVCIIDHDSGADITTMTLAQVIFDQEKRLGGIFPQSIMSHLIKVRDGSMAVVRQSFDSFLDPDGYFRQELQNRLDQLEDENVISTAENDYISGLLNAPRFEQTVADAEVSSEQIQTLMQQLETLEQELARLKQNK